MLIEITHLFECLDFNTESESAREMTTLTLIVTFDVFGSRNEMLLARSTPPSPPPSVHTQPRWLVAVAAQAWAGCPRG
jgi:hypothetical protein